MRAQPLLQPTIERRVPLRLLAYWEKLRRGRPMPSERDLVPEDISDLWDNCFLIPVQNIPPSSYRYSYIGRNIMEVYGGAPPTNDMTKAITPPAGVIDVCMTVLQNRKPLIESGEFTRHDNRVVKYRQCLLPLGEGDEVRVIFGALHLKVFPEQ